MIEEQLGVKGRPIELYLDGVDRLLGEKRVTLVAPNRALKLTRPGFARSLAA